MKIEIETKIKVDSLEGVAEALVKEGATPLGEVVERDCYFDDEKMGLLHAGCGIRLRERSSDGQKNFILTYKGEKLPGMFKSRQEIEVGVDAAGEMATLLGALGYEKKLEFEKRRSIWQLDDCEICLDELPLLGTFIEIEAADEQLISSALKKLGLQGHEHIDIGYARMISEKLKETGNDSRQVLFE
jgi:predicted adenylyl cyclase CyaB